MQSRNFPMQFLLDAGWTWCNVVWEAYIKTQSSISWDANAVTFGVLAIGGLGYVVGGLFSEKYGSARVAFVSLATSGMFCLLSPAFFLAPPAVMLIAYLIWGLAVVADSPQFSSLVATTAPDTNKGTALTIVNCIGFSITIASIQLLSVPLSEQYLFILLVPGPIFGMWSMRALAFPDLFASNALLASPEEGEEDSDIAASETGKNECAKEDNIAAAEDITT